MKKLKVTFFIFVCVVVFYSAYKITNDFYNGYEDGYNSMFDTYNNPDDFLVGRHRDEEGFWDYFYEPFLFQQGFEEGYKKAAREYYAGIKVTEKKIK